MELKQFAIFLFLTFLSSGLVLSQQQISEPDEVEPACIGCICEAASHCNTTIGCVNGMCGMFKITFPYWVDAGKPIIDGDDPDAGDAWMRCVNDPYCAGQTVVGYALKFKKDCNNDGKIDCNDYAWIHHLGGYGCGSRPLDQKYQAEFESCLKDLRIE